MTTGRINQVTTFYNRAESSIQPLLFSSREPNFAEESSLTSGECWSQLAKGFYLSVLADSSHNQREHQATTFQPLLFVSFEPNFAEESSLTISKRQSQLVNAFRQKCTSKFELQPNRLVPRTHNSQTPSTRHWSSNEYQCLRWKLPTTGTVTTKDYTQSRRIFSWLSATGIAISK